MTELVKRLDGSVPLPPSSLPCEIFKERDVNKDTGEEKKCNLVEVKGDGSSGIEGSISIRSKQNAIIFIYGLMEQFDIRLDDLDF